MPVPTDSQYAALLGSADADVRRSVIARLGDDPRMAAVLLLTEHLDRERDPARLAQTCVALKSASRLTGGELAAARLAQLFESRPDDAYLRASVLAAFALHACPADAAARVRLERAARTPEESRVARQLTTTTVTPPRAPAGDSVR